MVDFRPLLFINALALMLLVTAGYASVQRDMALNVAEEARSQSVQAADIEAEPEIFITTPRSEEPEMLAMAESTEAMIPPTGRVSEPFTLAETEPTPEPDKPAPTTGKLVLRSNVTDDTVTINGTPYGATRLDLELKPGQYDVVISKDGFKPWSQSISLKAGNELTLAAKLHAYTTVDYKNGTWTGGVKTGDGTYQDDNGLKYQGHFMDGQFSGEGTAWYPDGSRYEGDWEQGQRSGEGAWRDADGTYYSGEFEGDQFNGKGTLTMANGDILTGNWQRGRLNGHGSITTADGMLYVGSFRDDEFHGRGALTYPDGRHYEGEFSNGAFHGKGSEIFADGKKYEGEYMEGRFHGHGLLLNPNGSSIEATFKHGKPYGQVRLTTAAGEMFTARTTEPGVCYREKSYRATQCPQLEGW
ncbi:PEGA domain-containing protein [Marinobacter salinexigens]|uniref:PEGA domain-containing protein n=1 Tax=Marinobacter salinexigens TaxID=2919747 RepID=A0A5B0VJP2_9GAMM|nr:PEGA domain-containing protein [Marinobacter salinexigens]KAA1174862.1 PEGA domain-containing protein [Marinobacter salinexigens]